MLGWVEYNNVYCEKMIQNIEYISSVVKSSDLALKVHLASACITSIGIPCLCNFIFYKQSSLIFLQKSFVLFNKSNKKNLLNFNTLYHITVLYVYLLKG